MLMFKKGEPVEVPIDQIVPNPDQPRKNFSAHELDELCNSIREFGIIQPVILMRTEEKDKYVLIAGERRLRAATLIGLMKVPAIIRDATQKDSALIALVENVQRENLSYIEEASAYRKLIDDHGLTQGEIARRVGKQQSTISNKLRLLALPGEIQLMLAENNLSERHARALLRISDNELKKQVVEKIVKHNLNVKQSDKLIDDLLSKKMEENRKHEKISFINYRLYINTIKKAFSSINEVEKEAKYYQEDKGDFIEMKIIIPKNIKNSNVSRETSDYKVF